MNHKINDKVKVIKIIHGAPERLIGKIGIISGIATDIVNNINYYTVIFNDEELYWGFTDEELISIEQIESTTTQKVLQSYMECVNNIEDYFEYTYQSEQDKELVVRCIDNLTIKLVEIFNEHLQPNNQD